MTAACVQGVFALESEDGAEYRYKATLAALRGLQRGMPSFESKEGPDRIF